MTVSPEWLLAAALVGIYLLDSAHFLQIGEAVVSTRGASVRQVSFGSSFELGGRRPYLPNPLTPWRPDLRVDWNGAARGAGPEQINSEMRTHLQAVRPIARIASVCAVLVLVVAPLALIGGFEGTFALAILTCVVCAIGASAVVIRRRGRLGMTLWQALSLSFVAIICLPCSGNLGRAAAIQRHWAVQASDLEDLNFDGTGKAIGHARVKEMLTRALRLCVADSAEYQWLTAQLRQLDAKQD